LFRLIFRLQRQYLRKMRQLTSPHLVIPWGFYARSRSSQRTENHCQQVAPIERKSALRNVNNGVPVSPCVPIRPCVVNMVFSEDAEALTVDLRGFLRSSLTSASDLPKDGFMFLDEGPRTDHSAPQRERHYGNENNPVNPQRQPSFLKVTPRSLIFYPLEKLFD